MKFPRSSGILLHISCLPSKFGIGDLGPEAYRFVDWLTDNQQSLWQILPLSIADRKGCPYSSCSAYGTYPLLISPELLIKDKLLSPDDLLEVEELFKDRIDYPLVYEYKTFLFNRAFNNFKKAKKQNKQFQDFAHKQKNWLDDLASYIVLSEQFGNDWTNWPPHYRDPEAHTIEQFHQNNREQIEYHKFLQFIFWCQWGQLKKYANAKGVKIIGDIPIFLSHQSMDVWKNKKLFALADGYPYVVTGAPPDNFSPAGQKWGNPNYNWRQMEREKFSWWIARIRYNIELYDIIRLDHFRGFAATWEIPAANPAPTSGYWASTPGHALFEQLHKELGQLPLIAEDLGQITPDVEWLRDRFGFTGMKVLQFAFNEGEKNKHLPSNFESDNCVVYTGTHDNPTTKGWFMAMEETLEKDFLQKRLANSHYNDINWSLIAWAMTSRADMVIIPLQDILELDNQARMNTPGSDQDNWSWRFKWSDLLTHQSRRLTELTNQSKRTAL